MPDQIHAALILTELAIGWTAAAVASGAFLYILFGGNEKPTTRAHDRNLPRPKFDQDGERII